MPHGGFSSERYNTKEAGSKQAPHRAAVGQAIGGTNCLVHDRGEPIHLVAREVVAVPHLTRRHQFCSSDRAQTWELLARTRQFEFQGGVVDMPRGMFG